MKTEIPFPQNPFNISTQQAPFCLIYLEEADTNVCSWPFPLPVQCLMCYLGKVCRLRRRRQWHPSPVLLPGKSHGQKSLVGCSLWGCSEPDTTERLHFHFSLSCIGEGNGNPLQCSCLENPRDGGA